MKAETEEEGYRKAGLALGVLTIAGAGVLAIAGILGPMGAEGLVLLAWGVMHAGLTSERSIQ